MKSSERFFKEIENMYENILELKREFNRLSEELIKLKKRRNGVNYNKSLEKKIESVYKKMGELVRQKSWHDEYIRRLETIILPRMSFF